MLEYSVAKYPKEKEGFTMKKLLTLLLVALMTFSMVACGEETTSAETNKTDIAITKEEMLENASELNISELKGSIMENPVRAQETYVGNCYTYSGYVLNINNDSAQIGLADTEYYFTVYLSNDDLVQLDKNELVTVVGTVSDVNSETKKIEYTGGSYEKSVIVGTIQDAWLVTDTYELTGTLKMYANSFYYAGGIQYHNTDEPNAWYLIVQDGDKTKEYYLKEIQSVVNGSSAMISESEITAGTEITISGRVLKGVGEVTNPSLIVLDVILK